MEYYAKKKKTGDEDYHKRVIQETEDKYKTDLSTVSVNAFLDKANKYFSSASNSLRSTGYSTASKNAEERRKQAQELRMEALGVDRYLDHNRATIDKDTYDTLKRYVSEIGYETAKVTDAFDTAADYYSQFSDREKLNDYRENLRQNAWLDKYKGKSYTDLTIAASKMADGDEKRWVSRYADSVYTPEEGYAEVRRMENVLEEYKRLTRGNINDPAVAERLRNITSRYGGMDDIERAITEKRQHNTLLDRDIERKKMVSVGDSESENYDPDFTYWAKRRDKLPTAQEVENYDIMMDKSTWQTRDDGTVVDLFGNEIGRDEDGNVVHPTAGSVNAEDRLGIYLASKSDSPEYSVAENTWGTLDKIIAEGDSRHWDRLTSDQIDTYYYYLNKDGAESANRYLDLIQDTVNRDLGTEMYTEMQDDSKALKALFGLSVGTDQWSAGLGGFGRQLRGEDDYVAPSAKQYAGQMIKEDLGGGWEFAYDSATTIGNMAPSILTSIVSNAIVPGSGIVGSLVMGASASGSAYDQMINEGYSVKQARTYGTLVGASEVALQELLGGISAMGGGAVGKWISAADNALFRVASKAGDTAVGKVIRNMVSEGAEEGLQEVLGTWLKNMITHSEENVNWDEVAYSTLLGALTGGVFEAPSVAGDAIVQNKAYRDVGNTIIEAEGGVDALKALALDLTSSDSKLMKKAEKVTDEASRKNAKKVGKLYDAVRGEVTKQNRADIAKHLSEKGFSSTSAKNIAEAIAAHINGENLNKFQEMVLDEVQDNSEVTNAVNEVLTSETTNISKRTTDLEAYSRGVASGKGIAPDQTIRPKFDVSDEGKTVLHEADGTARQVEVKKVSDIKNGKVSLELTDGSVVDANSLSFASNGEAWTYSVLGDLGVTPEQANDILSNYDGKTDIDRVGYARGVQEAYRYGSVGIPLSKISSTGYAAKMTDGARAYAYNLGAMQAVTTAANKQIKNGARKIGEGKYYTQFTQERNGVHYDDVDISKERLNAQQKTGIQLAEFLAATGLDVHVYKSKLVDGKYDRDNGTYYSEDGSIHVDLNAGNKGEGLVAYTLSHETTHFIKDWSAEKYKVFADSLFEEMGKTDADIEGMVKVTLERVRVMKEYKGYSEEKLWDVAYDEVVAEMCETMLTDNDTAVKVVEKLKKTDSELLNKIIEFFDNLLTKLKNVLKVNAAYKDTESYSYIAQQAKETIKNVERLRDLYADALVDATQTYRKAEQKNTATTDSKTESVGVQIDAETKSVAPTKLNSERTWTASEYVQNREKAAVEISKKLGVSVEKALRYIDDINSVARLIADDRVRLDYEPNMDAHATVLKPNSEYKYTVDMSTLCAKRLLFTGTFDAIQKLLPTTVFDSEDIVRLREMMMQRGLEVACGICYVESTRREIGRITQEFIDRYKLAQQTGKPISRINSSGKEVTLAVKGTTFNADPNYTPTLGELNTTDIDLVKRDHREVYDAYLAFMNARGQAKPKLLETRAEYNGEILKSFKAKSAVNARNAHGGLRLQSFSDFEVPHMIDMMQVIMDMSRVGLKSQAYTKVPAFADVFGGSGVKINLSLIAKGSGLDANGNLVFDDVEGMNHNEAFRLREKYSKNVGTILVGKSDSHIIAAMADPRIDFIIPFHKSSWKESLYDALGLTGYADYTDTQNEKPIDKDRDIKNFDPSEYWDFSKTGDENAQIYLQKCREDGRIPKFPQFQGYPGYWKLLIDFKMYDNNGVGSPQEVVRPEFDMNAAEKILSEYQGGHRSFPVAKDVVEDFVNEYKANNPENADMTEQGEVRKSSRYTPEELFAKKPLAVATFPVKEVPTKRKKVNLPEVVKEAKNGAGTIAYVANAKNPRIQKYVYIPDLGNNVLVNTQGIVHGLQGRITNSSTMSTAEVETVLPDILRNSIAVNELNPREEDISKGILKSYVLFGYAKRHDGQEYLVRSTINHYSDNKSSAESIQIFDVLKGTKAKKMDSEVIGSHTGKPAASRLNTTKSIYTISVEDLLENVKNNYPEFLPDALRDYYGVDTPKEKGLLFSTRDSDSVSNRELLASALESVTEHEVERKKLQEYKSKISAMEELEQKLTDINSQIKELSFGKGPKDKAKLSALKDEKIKTQNRINNYDKQLLRIESTKALKNLLEREKKAAFNRAVSKARKAEDARTEAKLERIDKTKLRRKIHRVVKELDDMLFNESKKRHVPDTLKKSVSAALDILNMNRSDTEERVAKYANLIAEEKAKAEPDQAKIDAYTTTMENIIRSSEKLADRLKELHEGYESFMKSEDQDIASNTDPVITSAIQELTQTIGNKSIYDMSIDELTDVYAVYRMVLTRVRDANKALIESINASISEMATHVITEVRAVGGQRNTRVAMLDTAESFSWNNLKPVYAMERIGSNALIKVFNNVRAGEDVWAKDVTEATEYYQEKSKQYDYDKWDFDKKYRFESVAGDSFELTLEQMLSLYAYSKRDQAHDHLRLGGFVFDSNIETTKDKGSKLIKYKVNTADAHQIDLEILSAIIGNLTNEQMRFVDDMQEYLSTVMGAKGNEVTSKMYGVKLFKEKYYFPLKSAKQFMFEQNEVAGEVKIKNSGFTNKVVAKANNPVILSNFMDVWAGHVNDMSMYHAFTLPLEDFNRVFNYNSPKTEDYPSVSVKGTVQNAYGPHAVNYVKQLITDLNGGARSDPTESTAKALMSKFKKAKVMASASVVVQQPSAIARAFALVNPKYFRPTKDGMKHKELWSEVKQYAPVAIIKEMGYFDTNMGMSTTDFIKRKKYTGLEKVKAFGKDADYRDEALSWLPAMADELTWCAIWNAVKRETAATHKNLRPGTEEFLKAAGERFTEVITKTQVYDSVLARSANMRSKSGLMSMATSFMAEPTTTINMLEDAILKAKRGNKAYAVKAFASVLSSIVLNNALASIVYAARDDDEDETYWEKLAQAFVSGMIDDINPLTYYPFLKDMWSLLQGYDIERADMSLVDDLADNLQTLAKAYTAEDGEPGKAWWNLAGTVANLLGFPLQNIIREVTAVANWFKTIKKDIGGRKTTAGSMKDALGTALRDTVPVYGWVTNKDRDAKLYDAILRGDEAYVNRLKERYGKESKVNSGMRSAIKDHYLDGDISAETAIDYMVSYTGDEADEAYWNVEKWKYEAKFDEEFSKYDDFYTAVRTGKNLRDTIKRYTDNGITNETLKTQLTEHFKKEYLKMSTAEKANIKGYLLNAMTVLGNTRKEAEDKIKDWDFEAANGFSYGNRKQEYLEGDITKEQLENALVNYGGLNEEEVDDYFNEVLFEAEYGFPYENTGKLYKDGQLTRDEAFHIFTTQGEMSVEEAEAEIADIEFEMEYGFRYSNRNQAYKRGEITKDELYQHLTEYGGKTDDAARREIAKADFETEHGFSYEDRAEMYKDGTLSKTELKSILVEIGDYSEEDADVQIEVYDWQKDGVGLSNDNTGVIKKYNEGSLGAAGVDRQLFYEFYKYYSKSGEEGVKNSKVKECMPYIAALPISNAQKTAIANSIWAESTVKKYKQW